MQPYRLDNAAIAQQRQRFDEARKYLAAGLREEARRLWWWPNGEDFPKEHWSRRKVARCGCGKNSPEGVLALCAYCGGITTATPTAIPMELFSRP